MGSPAVHPELLGRDTESDQIEQSGNPTVEGVLIVTRLDVSSQCLYVGVGFFLQLNVLDESNTDGKSLLISSFSDRPQTNLLM